MKNSRSLPEQQKQNAKDAAYFFAALEFASLYRRFGPMGVDDQETYERVRLELIEQGLDADQIEEAGRDGARKTFARCFGLLAQMR